MQNKNVVKSNKKIKVGALLSLILLISVLSILLQFWIFEVFTIKTKLIVTGITLLITFGLMLFISHKNKKKKNQRLIKNLFAIFLSVIIFYGSYLYYQTNQILMNILFSKPGDTVIQMVVLKDSPIKSVKQLKDQTIGFQGMDNVYGYLKVVDSLESSKLFLNDNYSEISFLSYDAAYTALKNNEIQAMTFQAKDRKLIQETNPDFFKNVKVIKEFKFKNDDSAMRVDIAKESFNVIITGVDAREYGDFAQSNRIDSTILATINPNTMEVLLTSLPRDLLIPVACQNNEVDKLTHVGAQGMACVRKSIEQFLDIQINYEVRFEFNSVIKVVDTLGGIDVVVPYGFCELDSNDIDYTICIDASDTPQHLNGEQALAFARHRATVNDYIRGEAQKSIIEAIVREMKSTSGITKIGSIVKSVGETMETDFSRKEIYAGANLLSKASQVSFVDRVVLDGDDVDGFYLPTHDNYAFVFNAYPESVLELQTKIKDVMNKQP